MTNIFVAEVLKHQMPEAQGAMVLRGLGQTYTNAEAAAMLGIPIAAVMTARHSPLKFSQLIETPVRSAVAHLHGCRTLRSSSWKALSRELILVA